MGDSLSTGHGIDLESGWVSQLQDRLAHRGYRYNVINASISGETTRGANHRVDQILSRVKPSITVIELGGNDGLRGIPLAEIKHNLLSIIEKFSASGSRILLVEMLLPPNYGNQYVENFVAIYKQLSLRDEVTPTQFLLNKVADNPDLMQSDGIHPKAEAQKIMLDNLWPDLCSLLETGVD